MLAQCTVLTHLNLRANDIGPDGADSFAGVLGQCTTLTHLNLRFNQIGETGAESFAGVLGQCAVRTHLDLSGNQIETAGTESVAGVLVQCTALTHLDLHDNYIEDVGEGNLLLNFVVWSSLWTSFIDILRCLLITMFNRHVTRNSDILYTYGVVAFGLPLSLNEKKSE